MLLKQVTAKYIGLALLLIVIIGINIHYRLYPAYFPQFKKQAALIVEERIEKAALRWVDAHFASFSSVAKDNLIDEWMLEYKRNNKERIKKHIEREYRRLKSPYQDAKGQTYLMELDCWHWARYVENIVKHGYPGDAIVGGLQFDTLMLVPYGAHLSWAQFLFYSAAFPYSLFNHIAHVPLFTFLFYFPVLLSALFLIVVFFFCLRYKDAVAAGVSCLFIGLVPALLYRSCAGWFDTDIYNLLFPLLVVWCYAETSVAPNLFRWFLGLAAAAFFTGLFCWTWGYWWLIVGIIVVYECYAFFALVCDFFQTKKPIGKECIKRLTRIAVFGLLVFLWVTIFCGFVPWHFLIAQIRGSFLLNSALSDAIWPNVLSTVAELKQTDFSRIADLLGGMAVFVLAWVSLAITYLFNRKFSAKQREVILMLTAWFIITLFACFKGARFSIFLAVPLGISLGWVLSELYAFARLKKNKILLVVLSIAVGVLIGKIVTTASETSSRLYPLMNGTWYKTLITLKEKTPSDAIINAWWDFGDWIKTVSCRKVVADGQSQQVPQVYWTARALFKSDEQEALKILRMLNNGGNQAYEALRAHFKDSFKAVWFLEKLLKCEAAEKDRLLNSLPSDVSGKVKDLFNKKPPKAYILVDYSLINKVMPISYIANWDFKKVYLLRNRNIPLKELKVGLEGSGFTGRQIQKLYEEALCISKEDEDSFVSKKLKFYGQICEGEERAGGVFFKNGIVFFPGQIKGLYYSCSQSNYRIFKNLFLLKNDTVEEFPMELPDANFSCMVLHPGPKYEAFLLDDELARSLFVRLYFLKGKGLKHFKPLIEEYKNNNYIRVFEIIWD